MKNDSEHLNNLRHSCAHLLAAAVISLWPKAKRTIGPAIENGFYYDFDFGNVKISEADLPQIEAKMHELVKFWQGFERIEVTAAEAKKEYRDNPYKLELIDEFTKDGQKLTFYKSGDYVDLCRGGHAEHPQEDLKFFKLLSVAGAYWHGDEKNKMLTRIYGTVFPTKKELDHYLWQQEEAKKRDHRKLGVELELFKFEDIAPGAPFWYPKGMIIVKELEKLWRKIHEEQGYQEISTPIMVKSEVFKTSGHWDHYQHNMFNMILEDESYSLKPMNCPESTYVYKSKPRSYRDLPLRLSEIGRLHRREKSGELGGLLRVRQLTMDDAHIYTSIDKMSQEIESVLDLISYFYKIFSFKSNYYLSTRPEKFMGERGKWDAAEAILKSVLKKKNLNFTEKRGEGAFYGPKIDVEINDVLGRNWQLATVQLDFQMPLKFKLTYTNKYGDTSPPVMIHRAIFGSFERFIGILIEHYGGAFPLWLSPVQLVVVPIAERHNAQAQEAVKFFKDHGLRVALDDRNEPMQAKIRDNSLQKVPYLGIIGDKEAAGSVLAVRTRSGQDLKTLSFEAFLHRLKTELEHTA